MPRQDRNCLWILPYLDFAPGAGGSHLTAVNLLRHWGAQGTRFSLYTESSNGPVPADLRDAHLFLSRAEVQKALEDRSSLVFYYDFRSALHEVFRPTRYVVRYFALGKPFCYSTDRQRDGCWNQCNTFKSILHARRPQVLASQRRDLQYLAGAQSLNVCAGGLRDLMLKRFPQICDIPIEVLYEANTYNPTCNQRYDWTRHPDSAVSLLLVSKWRPHKGLLEILRRVVGHVHVTVVGDGPEMEIARDLYHSADVDFRGFVRNEDIYTQLPQRRYIYVHPARYYEGYGKTVSEALYAGIPVLIPLDSGAYSDLAGTPGVWGYDRRDFATLLPAIDEVRAHHIPSSAASAMFEASQRLATDVTARAWLSYIDRHLTPAAEVVSPSGRPEFARHPPRDEDHSGYPEAEGGREVVQTHRERTRPETSNQEEVSAAH